MARYINTKTKVVIDTDSKMLGSWVPVGTPLPDEKVQKQESKTEKVVPEPTEEQPAENEPADLKDIKKEQIMQELDAFGIKYDKRATKAELYKLMMAQGK